MIKRERYFKDLLTDPPVIGEPVTVRTKDGEIIETNPVTNWYVGFDRTKIETEDTVYIK